ncbi:DMT family transporter [Konateibacter massiliensis]|uniref:DMT family transporter n=1 Tax=Konateibacter massiliensis TaxID=2002841 RepID=UPI000C158296|nr:DMT family transporter [Konateibacter massiliensis]
MKAQRKRIAGILITLLGGIFWGMSGACGQYLFEYKDVTSKWLVPIRLVVAGYVMLSYFLVKDRKTTMSVWKTKRNAIDIVIYGLAGLMLCQYTYFATIEHSNAGTATVLQYMSPVMIMVVVCLMTRKLPKAAEVIAMVCALAGIFLIATHGKFNELVISKEALFYGIVSALTVVIYNLQPKSLMRQFSTPLLLAWAMTIGGTALFILFRPWTYSPIIDAETIAAMFAIIVLGTVISFTCYMQGVKWIGPTHASLYASVEPLVAAILSIVWLHVPFKLIDFIGFIFILSTIFILFFSSKGKKQEKSEQAA